MPFSIVNKEGRQILMLDGAVTIENAQEFAAWLGEDVEGGLPVGVDTEGLTDIDTCILQLLCSIRKTLPALSFDNPSEFFLSAVDRCGMRRELLSARESL
jgi:anti-anti-sigma regulatory factor